MFGFSSKATKSQGDCDGFSTFENAPEEKSYPWTLRGWWRWFLDFGKLKKKVIPGLHVGSGVGFLILEN